MGTVYLLHFDEPYHHAQHYIGYTTNPEQRFRDHELGRGARLMQVIVAAGITWRVARMWQGTREDERRLKRRKKAQKFCPLCRTAPEPVQFLTELPRP